MSLPKIDPGVCGVGKAIEMVASALQEAGCASSDCSRFVNCVNRLKHVSGRFLSSREAAVPN